MSADLSNKKIIMIHGLASKPTAEITHQLWRRTLTENIRVSHRLLARSLDAHPDIEAQVVVRDLDVLGVFVVLGLRTMFGFLSCCSPSWELQNANQGSTANQASHQSGMSHCGF